MGVPRRRNTSAARLRGTASREGSWRIQQQIQNRTRHAADSAECEGGLHILGEQVQEQQFVQNDRSQDSEGHLRRGNRFGVRLHWHEFIMDGTPAPADKRTDHVTHGGYRDASHTFEREVCMISQFAKVGCSV